MFGHFDEEIIIEYYECIDYERKVDVLCLDLFSNWSDLFVEVCGVLEVV